MASDVPLVRRGPLDAVAGELAGASSDLVRIEPVPFRSVLNLRGRASEELAAIIETAVGLRLPLEPNRWTGERDRAAIWLGPDEWLLLAPDGQSGPVERAIRNARTRDPWLAVTDVSHNYTGLLLSGPLARELLAGGCALDLHSSSFARGVCAQTTLARAPVWLRALQGDSAIEVWMRNSFAVYVVRWLAESTSTL